MNLDFLPLQCIQFFCIREMWRKVVVFVCWVEINLFLCLPLLMFTQEGVELTALSMWEDPLGGPQSWCGCFGERESCVHRRN
jgi:hypothetical protein